MSRRDGRGGGGLISLAVKGVASGIGLASEGIHAYKENKKEKKEYKAATNKDSAHDDSGNDGGAPPSYESISHDEERPQRRIDEEGHSTGENEKDPHHAWQGDDLEDEEYPPEYELSTDEQWDLDDAQHELHDEPVGAQTPPEQLSTRDIGQLAENFIRNCPLPLHADPTAQSIVRLPLPVILPQRRPKNRSRGFVRAYAPLLEPCGIDQVTWMNFLDTFDKASAASPWLNAINLAQIPTFLLPTVTGLLVGLAIQLSVNAAKEVHSRQRTNTFLDKINNDFFRPRGLFCLVMTWKPDDASWHRTVNVTSTISSSAQSSSNASGHSNTNPFESAFSNLTNKFKASSGVTYGNDFEFPEAAPLVFPALEQLGKETGAEAVRKRDKIKVGKTFVTEYLDRRARAAYNGQNPSSVLAQGPEEHFSSRYADPNHPASSGSLISLVTGGYVNPHRMDRGELSRDRKGRRGGGPLGLVGEILGRGGRQDEGRSYGEAGYGRSPAGRGSLGPGRYAEYEYNERQYHDRNRMGGAGMRGGQYAEYEHVDQQYGNGRNPAGMQGYARSGSSGYGASPGYGRRSRRGGNGPLKMVANPVKSLFKTDVLYLMVVNMPSDQEMNTAMNMINQSQDPPQGPSQGSQGSQGRSQGQSPRPPQGSYY